MSVCSQLAYKEKASELKKALREGELKYLQSFEHNQIFAYLAVHESYAVLAFRGTVLSEYGTIKADLDTRFYHSKSGNLHRGFYTAYKGLASKIERALKKIEVPLYVTGHSLGGALALVATINLKDQDRIAACYTFGCPRVGNAEFAEKLFKVPVYRCVHHVDVVPSVPLFLMGYAQYGDLRYLQDNGKVMGGSYPVFKRLLAQMNPFFWPRFVADHAIGKYAHILYEFAKERSKKRLPLKHSFL